MRIGICLNMLADQPGDTGIGRIEEAAQVGFDYAELPLAEMSAMPEGDFAELAERVKRSGIRCEACNNFFPKNLRLTGPETDIPAIKAYISHALSRAERLGVEYVVFGSGPAKSAPEGFPLDEAYRQVIDITRMAADEAAPRGIAIVIEPLRSAESNLINTYREGCALVGDAQRRNVYALVDFYHFCEMDEPTGNILTGGSVLRHAHFARRRGRAFPMSARDESRYADFAGALQAIGYEGRISLEAYTGDFGGEAPAALLAMRELFGGRK